MMMKKVQLPLDLLDLDNYYVFWKIVLMLSIIMTIVVAVILIIIFLHLMTTKEYISITTTIVILHKLQQQQSYITYVQLLWLIILTIIHKILVLHRQHHPLVVSLDMLIALEPEFEML